MILAYQPSAAQSRGDDEETAPRRSLHEDTAAEALRYKRLGREKAGRDLGESAILGWIGLHWRSFVRDRWVAHLEGREFWIELDEEDFGLLARAFSESPLFDEVVRKIKTGGETLDILCWSVDS